MLCHVSVRKFTSYTKFVQIHRFILFCIVPICGVIPLQNKSADGVDADFANIEILWMHICWNQFFFCQPFVLPYTKTFASPLCGSFSHNCNCFIALIWIKLNTIHDWPLQINACASHLPYNSRFPLVPYSKHLCKGRKISIALSQMGILCISYMYIVFSVPAVFGLSRRRKRPACLLEDFPAISLH